MEYLSSDKRYGISDKYSAYNRYRILVLRYAIAQNSYQKFVLTVLATGVSDETVAWVSENSDTLQGMSVNEETVRKYNDSKYFAHIIGYTGQISVDEYKELSKKINPIPLPMWWENQELSRSWTKNCKAKRVMKRSA